jgi:hypothetical protein
VRHRETSTVRRRCETEARYSSVYERWHPRVTEGPISSDIDVVERGPFGPEPATLSTPIHSETPGQNST